MINRTGSYQKALVLGEDTDVLRVHDGETKLVFNHNKNPKSLGDEAARVSYSHNLEGRAAWEGHSLGFHSTHIN